MERSKVINAINMRTFADRYFFWDKRSQLPGLLTIAVNFRRDACESMKVVIVPTHPTLIPPSH